MANLFSEITIKNRKIKNRVVFPAMVVVDLDSPGSLVNEGHLKHFKWLADTDVGMIITGAAAVHPEGKMALNGLGIWSDEFIDGFSKIAQICHEKDAAIIMQLVHGGFRSETATSGLIAPSDFKEGDINARAMTKEEIKALQKDYVAAALRAKKAGFDGVELHGAHRYLISEFFSSVFNKRTDEYGGTPENRARFATEIIKEIRKQAGDDFIITCRMGANDPALADAIAIAKALEAAGADFLDVSYGTLTLIDMTNDASLEAPADFPHSGVVYAGSKIKENVSVPVASVWDIKTPEQANEIIEKGYADFVDVLRGILCDPEWVRKGKKGEAVDKCVNCKPACKWYGDRNQCPRYKKQDEAVRLKI